MKIAKSLLIICLILNLSNCMNYDFRFKKTQQGTLLPADKIAQLHQGMTKKEVEDVMGTSLLVSTFSENRWDYAYTKRIGSGPISKQHLIVYFENGRVVKVES